MKKKKNNFYTYVGNCGLDFFLVLGNTSMSVGRTQFYGFVSYWSRNCPILVPMPQLKTSCVGTTQDHIAAHTNTALLRYLSKYCRCHFPKMKPN